MQHDLQCTDIKLKCGFLDTKAGLIALSCAPAQAHALSSISQSGGEEKICSSRLELVMEDEEGLREVGGKGRTELKESLGWPQAKP